MVLSEEYLVYDLVGAEITLKTEPAGQTEATIERATHLR